MSYQTQALLNEDSDFTGRRCRSCLFQKASEVYQEAGSASDVQALSSALLKDDPAPLSAFLRAICAAPGFADMVDNGDGTIDQSKISDEDLLAAVTELYPVIATLFFTSDGTPV
jgi:hypothetical protein